MSLSLPLYSAVTAALILILQLGLMLAVGLTRVRFRQGIGDGGHEALALTIRRHGNLAENGAIFVIVLVLLEMMGGDPGAVLGLGLGFVVVRILHAIGLTLGTGVNVPRLIGSTGTILLGLGTAGYLLAVAVRGLSG